MDVDMIPMNSNDISNDLIMICASELNMILKLDSGMVLNVGAHVSTKVGINMTISAGLNMSPHESAEDPKTNHQRSPKLPSGDPRMIPVTLKPTSLGILKPACKIISEPHAKPHQNHIHIVFKVVRAHS